VIRQTGGKVRKKRIERESYHEKEKKGEKGKRGEM